jgi:hypothetical protein
MAIALNDIYRVAVVMRRAPQNALNVTHWRAGIVVGPGQTDLQLANGMFAYLRANYAAYMTASARVDGVMLQKISPGPVGPLVLSTDAGIPGTIDDDTLPYQTAMVLSIRSFAGGRRGRGRIYLPFWPEGNNSVDAQPDIGALAKGLILASNYLSPAVIGTPAVNTVAMVLGVWSHLHGTFADALSMVPRTDWGTQRRRSRIGRVDTPIF